MPIYEYKCPACGDTREVIEHTWNPVPPLCNLRHPAEQMVRLPSAPVAHFIGAGFHVNDYKRK